MSKTKLKNKINEEIEKVPEKVIEYGTRKIIDGIGDIFESIIKGNKEHKERLNKRNIESKEREELISETRNKLENLYNQQLKETNENIEEETQRLEKFLNNIQSLHIEQLKETKLINDTESSNPDRKSRDSVAKYAAFGAGAGIVGAGIIMGSRGVSKNKLEIEDSIDNILEEDIINID